MTNQELLNKIEELKTKATEYDNLNNEGHEGYNPYRDELENLNTSQLSATDDIKKDEWTKEETIGHRIEWNTFVKSNMQNGKLLPIGIEVFNQNLYTKLLRHIHPFMR